MKNITPLLLGTLMMSVGFLTLAQAQEKTKTKTTTATANSDKPAMPYVAQYSSKFEMADPAKARLVLDLWKDYDDNVLDRHKSYFADTVAIFLADGRSIKGIDTVLAKMKSYRGSFASAKSSIDVYMSLRSTD